MSIDPQQTPGQEPSLKKKIIEGIKLIPLVGSSLAYLIEHWGIRETIFLIVGFAIGWVVVFSGKAPEVLVKGYRVSTPPTDPKDKPARIDILPAQAIPKGLDPYSFWLEKEIDSLKEQNIVKGYQSCSFYSQELSSTSKYTWKLEADLGYRISGRGFKLNHDGTIEILELSKPKDNIIDFTVPKSLQGYKLLALLALSWDRDLPVSECSTLLTSSAN
jgi:hypothetical protein